VFNLQGSEIIVILLLALVVLGPEKLPDAVRRFMQTYNELRKMSHGFQSELKSALDEPMKELRDTANLIKDQADPHKLMAESNAEHRLEHTEHSDQSALKGPAPSSPWGAPTGDAAPTIAGRRPPLPAVRPAGSIRPVRQPDHLDDGEAAAAGTPER
jgi:sec-independent protein translocase protein TatB